MLATLKQPAGSGPERVRSRQLPELELALTLLAVPLGQVHRLVVVDEHDVVKGIVSLSDILQALVLTGGEKKP
jgi:CBS-domain-containing membrane protein